MLISLFIILTEVSQSFSQSVFSVLWLKWGVHGTKTSAFKQSHLWLMCKFSCSWYLHIPHLFIDSLETMWPRRAKSHFLTIVGTAGARLVWGFTFPHWKKSINLLVVTQALNFFKISSGSVQRSHAGRWLVWWKRRAFSHILRCRRQPLNARVCLYLPFTF